MQKGTNTSEWEQPRPPRFWWLKRLTIAVIVMAGALVLARWQWGRWVRGLIDAEQAAWAAAGEPMRPGALGAAVPDEDNAAWFIMEALTQFAPRKVAEESSEPYDDGELLRYRFAGDEAIAAAHLERNRASLNLLRAARGRSAVDWRDTGSTLGNQAWGLEKLFHLLRVAAMNAHLKGDDAAAVDYMLDLLHMVDALEDCTNDQVSQRSSTFGSHASTLVQDIAPRLNSGPHPATLEQVHQLASRLRDERRTTMQVIRTLSEWRAQFLADADAMPPARHYGGPTNLRSRIQHVANPVVHPAVQMQRLRAVRSIGRVMDRLRVDDWSNAVAIAVDNEATRQAYKRSHIYVLDEVVDLSPGWNAEFLVRVHHRGNTERQHATRAVEMRLFVLVAKEIADFASAPLRGLPTPRASGHEVADDEHE